MTDYKMAGISRVFAVVGCDATPGGTSADD
jgi:hypothetical protein